MTETNVTNNTETESTVYPVEQAYAETPKRSAKKTFSLANLATLEVDASKNIISTTIDVTDEICTAPLPLSLVCTEDGKFFKLNVDESMGICTFDDGSQGFVYTDAKGQKLLFKELLYKVSDSGDKYYVNKQRSDITLKDGALYDEEDGKQVFIEYRQKDGWTVVPKIDGFKGIELIDTREEEEKQYEEQYKYYKDILDNYVLVEKSTTDGVEAITITPIYENGYNGEEAPTLLSNSEEGTEQFILQKSDALTYNSIVGDLVTLNKEKGQNHDRKSLLPKELENIEKSIEAFRNDAVFNKTVYTKFMDTYFEIGDWTPDSELNQEKPTTPWEVFTKGGIVVSGASSSEDIDETEQSLNSILSDEEAKKFVRIRHTSNNDNVSDIYVKSFLDCFNDPSNNNAIVYARYLTARYYFEQGFNDETEMIVPRDEANRYASLLLQKSMLEDEIAKLGDSDYSTENDAQVDGETTKVLKDRISALELQKEYLEAKAGTTLEELEKCRKEYATAKLNYDTYISTKTEFAITNGTIIKTFNKNGKLVSILGGQDEVKVSYSPNNGKISELSDESGNYISFTYFEDMGENVLLKSIITSLGQRLTLSYSAMTEGEELDLLTINTNNDEATFNFDSKNRVVCVQSSTQLKKTVLTYEDNDLVNIKQYSAKANDSNNTQEYELQKEVNILSRRYIDEPDITFTSDNYSETFKTSSNGELLGHYELRDGLVSDAIIYTYTPYWSGLQYNFLNMDRVRTSDKSCLNNSLIVDFDIVDKVCITRTLNTFNNPIIEEVTGKDLTNKGIQKIVTNFTYDDMQNVVKKTETVTLTDSTVSHVTHTIYEYANGVLVKEVSYVEGEESTRGRDITEYEYSEDGKVKKVSYNTLQSSDKICEESIYDKNGLKLCDFDITGRHKIEYAYNKDKSVREISLPNGSKLAYGYDSYGNVTSISQSTLDGIENSTDRTYSDGKIAKLTSGHTSLEYGYNEKGLITSVKLNGVENYATNIYEEDVTLYRFDDVLQERPLTVDKVSMTTLGIGTKTTYTDKYGKIIEKRFDEMPIASYTYDEKDRLVSVVDGNAGSNETYEYDNKDNLTKYKKGTFEEKLTHATTGEVTQSEKCELTFTYTYSNDSRRELESVSVLDTTYKTYKDCIGRNIGNEIRKGADILVSSKINYVKHGDHTTTLPSTIKYMNFDQGIINSVQKIIKYSYDGMGNIKAIYENGKLKCRYEYDTLNRLTREDNKAFNKTWTYLYDDNGNIIEKRTYNFTLCDTMELDENSSTADLYVYNAIGDRLEKANDCFINYDNYGHLSSYKYNDCTWFKGKITQFGSHVFAYDRLDRRIRKNNITYTYDSQGRLVEQSNGVKFIYDANGIISIVKDDNVYFYEKDAQGNIISILDSLGYTMVRYEYDAWGNHKVLNQSGNEISDPNNIGHINPIRYRSYYYDPETGLYYLPARYYDPTTGRFISADDIEYADPETINGLNLYAYCGNNPVMNIDPTGHDWDWNSFWQGVGYLVTGIGAIVAGALVIASGVATWPMFLVAGITIGTGALTTINGISEVVEAGTGYNFVEDTIFGGNSSGYNIYATITGSIATVGSIICGGWYRYNTPRIQAYKNVGNYNFSGTLSDSTHLARPYQHSTLLQRNIIKYGKMIKESSGIYSFNIGGAYKIGWVSYGVGNVGSNPVTWKLVLDIGKQIILHAGF